MRIYAQAFSIHTRNGHKKELAMNTKTILPPEDIMFTFNQEMYEICKPLELLGITFFNYLKIFKDGSRIDLNSNQGITDYYYYKSDAYIGQCVEWNPFELSEGFMLWSNFDDKAWNVMAEVFNTTHGITFLQKHEHYCELFHFAAAKDNHRIVNFYINNQDLLKSFMLYFKDKGKKLIERAEEYKIIIQNYQQIAADFPPPQNGVWGLEQHTLDQFMQQLTINRAYIPSSQQNYLTKQELICLKWAAKGKSAEEIALILNISKRTCETHLDNIKNKLNCHKQLMLGFNLANIIPKTLLDSVG